MDPKGFGSHAYSQEELVAEMTAAFLCGWCGILLTTEENQVAYLNGWLSRLKADPSLLIKAGAQAQHAFDYIMGVHKAVTNEATIPASSAVGVVAERLAA
jgi:antirestriction protein ArdC